MSYDVAETNDETFDADVCIVGAGPAGITIAKELDRHGVRVCLLEAGSRNPDSDLQQQSRGESDGYPIHQLHRSRIRAFGGSLRHQQFRHGVWAARPLDRIDFEPREGRPNSGWPFDREHLDPYYSRAAGLCGVRQFDEAASNWWQQVSADGHRLLSDPELRPAIFQYARPDFQDAWQALSASCNVRLLMETRAAEVRTDLTGLRVQSIVAVRRNRARVCVRPRLVVFAAGGVENARLLLTANEGHGLGNEHDLVGRYFAERLWFHAGHVVLSKEASLDQLECFHGPEGAALGGGLRVAEGIVRERQLPNTVFFLVPRPAAVASDAIQSLSTLRKAVERRPLVSGLGWHTANILKGAPDLARFAMSRVVPGPRVLTVRAQAEQSPNRNSRVTLGTRRDDLGKPLARVTWQPRDDDLRSIQTSARLVDAALRAQGLGHLEWTARVDGTTLVEGLYHHLGTTRMHGDPRQGVVDADSRIHSVPNLFIAGSSVFPTYGASNPTLTIVALALRVADTLRAALKHDNAGAGDR